MWFSVNFSGIGWATVVKLVRLHAALCGALGGVVHMLTAKPEYPLPTTGETGAVNRRKAKLSTSTLRQSHSLH